MIRRRNCIFALATISLTFGCQQPNETRKQADPASSTAAMVPALPIVVPPLSREGLLLAVAHAASAAALGQSDTDEQRKLDGKRFELRMRFGCDDGTVTTPDDPRSWAFDEKRRVLSLQVKAELSKKLPLIEELSGDSYEAVEGFWIRRPWLLTAACPATPPKEEPQDAASEGASPAKAEAKQAASEKPAATPSPDADLTPRIGIAQFFTPTDARTHRRDNRAYKTTRVLKTGETPSANGYDLVISGRLRRLADGRVIACRIDNPSAPPDCILSAEFDKVSIELPTGEIIAKWSSA
jgi:hypothetical protein